MNTGYIIKNPRGTNLNQINSGKNLISAANDNDSRKTGIQPENELTIILLSLKILVGYENSYYK